MGDLYDAEHGVSREDSRDELLQSFIRSVLIRRSEENGSGPFSLVIPPDNEKPPAAASVIENLPRVLLPNESNGSRPTCSICTDDVGPSEVVLKLPCGHTFHEECIVPWLKKVCTCPLCREELKTDDREYEERKELEKRRKAVRAMQQMALC